MHERRPGTIILANPGDDGARKLAEKLSMDDTVSTLNLSAQNIGAGAAEALGIALRASLSTTSVDCSLNAELGDEGVAFLVPALRTDGTGISTIRVLSLMRCGIGEAGTRVSLAFVETNEQQFSLLAMQAGCISYSFARRCAIDSIHYAMCFACLVGCAAYVSPLRDVYRKTIGTKTDDSNAFIFVGFDSTVLFNQGRPL